MISTVAKDGEITLWRMRTPDNVRRTLNATERHPYHPTHYTRTCY
jgi:hypothetical protein